MLVLFVFANEFYFKFILNLKHIIIGFRQKFPHNFRDSGFRFREVMFLRVAAASFRDMFRCGLYFTDFKE